MNASRILLALLAWSALLGSSALAAPPGGIGIGVGAGAHGGIGVGAPPIGVPVHVPPANVPPVSVPKPQASALPTVGAKASGSAHASTQSSLIAGDVLHGTVSSVSGTNVTVAQSNGTTQTYTVSAQTAARLQSYLNKTIAFHVQSGTLALVGLGTPPLRGTVESVSGTMAQVKLANGTTQTYTVTAQQAAWLQAHAGKTVAFWTNANGTIELNQSSHGAKTAHRQSRTH
jgi:hypothetical protein